MNSFIYNVPGVFGLYVGLSEKEAQGPLGAGWPKAPINQPHPDHPWKRPKLDYLEFIILPFEKWFKPLQKDFATMAEWNPRSTTPFSEVYTPPTRGHSLVPSTRWPSRSRSGPSSDGSSPPPEDARSEPGEIDDQFEDDDDSPIVLSLENLSEPEERGRRGEGSQTLPQTREVVNPPALPLPRSASSQDMVDQALPQEFLDAIGISPIPTTKNEALPPAAPYFNPLQSNPHHNPFQRIGRQAYPPAQQPGLLIPRSNLSFERSMSHRMILPSTGPRAPEHILLPNTSNQVISPEIGQRPVIPNPPPHSNSFPSTSDQALPLHMGHHMTTPEQQNTRKRKRIEAKTPPFTPRDMAGRLLNPIEHVLQAGGYNTAPEASSQHQAERTGTTLSASEAEKNQLMFTFLAELGRDIARSAKYKPLLEMNGLAFSTFPANDEEREQHLQDIRQIMDINTVIGRGISTCESMIERFHLLREDNVKRINYTRSYISILRTLPIDVLYLIFDCCVYEAGVSPWTLVAISRQFRREAGGYQKIWASICLDTIHPVYQRRQDRYADCHHICRSLKELDRALSRSGDFPLTIKINTCSKAMAGRLIRDRHRWFNIKYYSYWNDSSVEKVLFPQTLTEAEKAAALGIASLEIHWHSEGARGTHLSKWIKHHKPRRISLDWRSNFGVLPIPQNAPLEQQWWTQLRTLELEYPCHIDPQSQVDRTSIALAIIKQTKHTVTELKLKYVLWGMITDQIRLPNLQKLSLIEVRYWWNIIGSGVTELELSPPTLGRHETETRGTEPPPGVKAVFPELKTLRYRARRCGMRGAISAPKLELLEYHAGKSEGGFVWESDQDVTSRPTPCLTPKKLHMYDVQVRFADLIQGMRSLRDLEEVHFYSSQLRVGFLRAMVGSIKETLLPNVTEIVMELAAGNGMPDGPRAKESYTEIFKSIAEGRNGRDRKWRGGARVVPNAAKTLNYFTVKWTTEMGGGTDAFVSPPEGAGSQWTEDKVPSGRMCYTLAPRPVGASTS